MGILGLILAGFCSDKIGRRAPFAVLSFISTSVLLFWAAATTKVYLSVLLISAATGTISIFNGVFWAMVQTRLPGHLVGFGTGLISGVGNFFSALAPVAIGLLIQFSNSYFVGILYLVGFGIVGAVCSVALTRGETMISEDMA
jgi:MFS family permease